MDGNMKGLTDKVEIRLCSSKDFKTRSSWLNCVLRDDEAVYWVGIGY